MDRKLKELSGQPDLDINDAKGGVTVGFPDSDATGEPSHPSARGTHCYCRRTSHRGLPWIELLDAPNSFQSVLNDL